MNTVRITEYVTSKYDFHSVSNIDDIILDRVIKHLSIRKGTYIFDPEIGSELYKYVFAQSDLVTYKSIESEIKYILSKFKDVELLNVSISTTSDRKGVEVNVTIYIKPSGSKKVITLYVTNEYISLIGVDDV